MSSSCGRVWLNPFSKVLGRPSSIFGFWSWLIRWSTLNPRVWDLMVGKPRKNDGLEPHFPYYLMAILEASYGMVFSICRSNHILGLGGQKPCQQFSWPEKSPQFHGACHVDWLTGHTFHAQSHPLAHGQSLYHAEVKNTWGTFGELIWFDVVVGYLSFPIKLGTARNYLPRNGSQFPTRAGVVPEQGPRS